MGEEARGRDELIELIRAQLSLAQRLDETLDHLATSDPDELARLLAAEIEGLAALDLAGGDRPASEALIKAIHQAAWRAERPGEAYPPPGPLDYMRQAIRLRAVPAEGPS